MAAKDPFGGHPPIVEDRNVPKFAANDEELEAFLNQKIDRTPQFYGLVERVNARREVLDNVTGKAGGMFLHGGFQIEALTLAYSLKELRRIMNELPPDARSLYFSPLKRLENQPESVKQFVNLALLWAVYAERLLSYEELQYAVTFIRETLQYDVDDLANEQYVMGMCCGIITLDKENRVVSLIHESARELLTEILRESFPHPHDLITTSFLTLFYDANFQNTDLRTEAELQNAYDKSPLLRYAQAFIGFHAPKCDDPPTIERTSKFILECKAYPYRHHYIAPSDAKLDIFNAFHVAVLFNLPDVLKQLVTEGKPSLYEGSHFDVNTPTKEYGTTPLIVASGKGYQEVIQCLLSVPGIEVNHADEDGHTALFYASKYGYQTIVSLLLQVPGIDVNHSRKEDSTTLAAAEAEDAAAELPNAPGTERS